jgi:hypothetical protein
MANNNIENYQEYFNQIKFKYIPNVALDFICKFSVVNIVGFDNNQLRFLTYLIPANHFYLVVHFTDKSEIKVKIKKHEVSSLKVKVDFANLYLAQIE